MTMIYTVYANDFNSRFTVITSMDLDGGGDAGGIGVVFYPQ